MSEIGETFAALKEVSRAKRAANVLSSAELLAQAGIAFTDLNDDGIHLRLLVGRQLIDFWPSTGRWMLKGSPRKHRGVKSLIAFIKARS